jgi:hypothetical protein
VLLIHTMIILSHSHITITCRVRAMPTPWLSVLVKPSPEELTFFSFIIDLEILVLLVVTALTIYSSDRLQTVPSLLCRSYFFQNPIRFLVSLEILTFQFSLVID